MLPALICITALTTVGALASVITRFWDVVGYVV